MMTAFRVLSRLLCSMNRGLAKAYFSLDLTLGFLFFRSNNYEIKEERRISSVNFLDLFTGIQDCEEFSSVANLPCRLVVRDSPF